MVTMRNVVFGGLIIAIALTFSIAIASYTDIQAKTMENPEITSNSFMLLQDRADPKDRISEEKIQVYNDRIVIKLENPEWSRFSDTKSMEPVIYQGANAIQVIPENQEELQEGDIISFETDYGTIIHRIIKIDYDKEGWYAITKGDNSPVNDSEKVRFTQIKRVVVAIIY